MPLSVRNLSNEERQDFAATHAGKYVRIAVTQELGGDHQELETHMLRRYFGTRTKDATYACSAGNPVYDPRREHPASKCYFVDVGLEQFERTMRGMEELLQIRYPEASL